MAIRIEIVANAGAGGAAATAAITRVVEACAAAGIDARVCAVPGNELSAALRAAVARSPDAVAVAGGDGTVSTAASILARTRVPLGVLPMGTLNHFAKDIGLPLELGAAVALLASGRTRRIDVASVNGRVFVNNSSIGLYPEMVRARDHHRRHLGLGKWPAMALAAARSLRRLPLVRCELEVAGRVLSRVAPFVFIGNNAYAWSVPLFGRRERLDAGRLWCYFPARRGRGMVSRLAVAAAFNHLERARDFVGLSAREIVVRTRRRRVAVSLDGEVIQLTPPLRYRALPGALLVVAEAA